jgi:hypothetical protein
LAWGDPLTIETGEMDDPLRHRFVISIGGNGDLYLQVTPNNKRASPPVHVVTHGGHISQMPGVTRALFELYRELWDHHSQNDQIQG